MTHNFLLEIGLEEMPAHVVEPSMRQLKEKTIAFLEENVLTYESVDMFSTPRRLAVRINGLADKQVDTEEEVKGPAKKIALDSEGNWTKAAQGFVRGQGLTVEDIYFQEIKEVEYVHVRKFTAGKGVEEVLPGLLSVIKSLSFPVSMHWANYDMSYIRPIHWLVALLDDKVIPFSLLDVETGRVTRGHRFLGHEAVEIAHANQYEEIMEKEYVVVDSAKRQQMIVDQIHALAKEHQWQVDQDSDLLEEVSNLVEYPTAFYGSFDAKYLEIPTEVLVTSMKEHQRYFDVHDQDGKLLPFFISVRNGNGDYLENVIRGNEKVLTARLEDAAFFYEEDKALTIEECVAKLKQVTFHEKIGTIYEKMQRVAVFAKLLGEKVGLTEEELADLDRASHIYKFDLVTNMVDEFPELEGIMGEKYALMQGEPAGVATAIREHYMPISSEGELPQSTVGAVLAVADKLDTVMTFFGVGMVPSGSNDPYALRRQTYGVIRIVVGKEWSFPLIPLYKEMVASINADPERYGLELPVESDEIEGFVTGRMKQFLSTKDIRHDIIEAATQANQTDLFLMVRSALMLKEHTQDIDFKTSNEALTRVINLALKGKELLSEDVDAPVDPSLFENSAEKDLYQAVEGVLNNASMRTIEENYEELKKLSPIIEKYFDNTMVMVDNDAVRNNRLRQLQKIAKLALSIASLDLLITKN